VLLCLLPLGACENLVRLDADSFDIGSASPEKFEADDAACRGKASQSIDYDMRQMEAGYFERHRAYNHVYVACMEAFKYTPRSYLKNLAP
ncbi:MAG TPA: hypothetical protein VIJ72_07265, partial [Rhizomicrobium sp.]